MQDPFIKDLGIDPETYLACLLQMTFSFMKDSWLKWDQISIGLYNTKNVMAGSVRTNIPYMVRINIPQTGLNRNLTQARQVTHFSTDSQVLEIKVSMSVRFYVCHP